MKKRVISVMMSAMLLAGMLTGCGSTVEKTDNVASAGAETTTTAKTEESKEAGKEASGDAVTISYACWDSNQATLLRTMADEFEAENPNIKIDIQVNGCIPIIFIIMAPMISCWI